MHKDRTGNHPHIVQNELAITEAMFKQANKEAITTVMRPPYMLQPHHPSPLPIHTLITHHPADTLSETLQLHPAQFIQC